MAYIISVLQLSDLLRSGSYFFLHKMYQKEFHVTDFRQKTKNRIKSTNLEVSYEGKTNNKYKSVTIIIAEKWVF